MQWLYCFGSHVLIWDRLIQFTFQNVILPSNIYSNLLHREDREELQVMQMPAPGLHTREQTFYSLLFLFIRNENACAEVKQQFLLALMR